MMGAEEYGIGTAALIAMGCIMVRQCQSNTCPVGVCTQDPALRERFQGTADKVVNLFSLLAQQPGITRGVNMVGIAQRILLQQAKPAGFRGHQLRGIAAVVLGKAQCSGLEPEGLKARRRPHQTCHSPRLRHRHRVTPVGNSSTATSWW